jgi:hypothetical protein
LPGSYLPGFRALIAISGVMTPEIAIKSPDALDVPPEQILSVTEVASDPA